MHLPATSKALKMRAQIFFVLLEACSQWLREIFEKPNAWPGPRKVRKNILTPCHHLRLALRKGFIFSSLLWDRSLLHTTLYIINVHRIEHGGWGAKIKSELLLIRPLWFVTWFMAASKLQNHALYIGWAYSITSPLSSFPQTTFRLNNPNGR